MKMLMVILAAFALMYFCVTLIATLSILVQYAYFRITGDDTLENELSTRINEYEDSYFETRERNIVNTVKLIGWLNFIEPFWLLFVI